MVNMKELKYKSTKTYEPVYVMKYKTSLWQKILFAISWFRA